MIRRMREGGERDLPAVSLVPHRGQSWGLGMAGSWAGHPMPGLGIRNAEEAEDAWFAWRGGCAAGEEGARATHFAGKRHGVNVQWRR